MSKNPFTDKLLVGEYKNMLEIAPLGFDVHKRMLNNLQYRIDTFGDYPVFQTWKNYEENLANIYIDIEFPSARFNPPPFRRSSFSII